MIKVSGDRIVSKKGGGAPTDLGHCQEVYTEGWPGTEGTLKALLLEYPAGRTARYGTGNKRKKYKREGGLDEAGNCEHP